MRLVYLSIFTESSAHHWSMFNASAHRCITFLAIISCLVASTDIELFSSLSYKYSSLGLLDIGYSSTHTSDLIWKLFISCSNFQHKLLKKTLIISNSSSCFTAWKTWLFMPTILRVWKKKSGSSQHLLLSETSHLCTFGP